MDYSTIETIMQSPEVLLGAGFVVGSGLTYLVSRLTSNSRLKKAQYDRDIRLEQKKTEQAGYETTRQQALTEIETSRTSVELKKLEFENAECEHKRRLDLIEREREYKLDDEKRKDSDLQSQRSYESAEKEKDRQIRLQQTEIVAGQLRSALEQYVEILRQPSQSDVDSNYEKQIEEQREGYRKELVEGVIEKHDEDNGFYHDLIYEKQGVFDAELLERIEHVVDAKFPPRQSIQRVPRDLRQNLEKLLDLLDIKP